MRIGFPVSPSLARITAGSPQIAHGNVSTHCRSRGGRGIDWRGIDDPAMPTQTPASRQGCVPGDGSRSFRQSAENLAEAPEPVWGDDKLSNTWASAQFSTKRMLRCTQHGRIPGSFPGRDNWHESCSCVSVVAVRLKNKILKRRSVGHEIPQVLVD